MNRSPYDRVISHLRLQQVSSVGELSAKYIRERHDDFSDARLAGKLGSLAAGELVTLPTDSSEAGIAIEEGTLTDLYELPRLGYGRHESRTNVRFGQLVVDRPGQSTTAELVAVKYTSPKLAAREFAATRAVRSRLGDAAAYQPLGFIASDSRKVGGITRYRHEVTALDSVLWSEESTDEQRLAAAAFAGEWMGTLHEHGIIHGDAQAKNMARDGAGRPIFIDLETAHEASGENSSSVMERAGDIEMFLRYLPERLSPKAFESFMETYVDTHQSRMVLAARIRDIYEMPLLPIYHFAPDSMR